MLHSAFGVIGPTRATVSPWTPLPVAGPNRGDLPPSKHWFWRQRLRFPLTRHPPPSFPLLTSLRLSICGEDLQYDGDDDEKSASSGGTRSCVCATFVNCLFVTKKRSRDARCRGSTVARKQIWCSFGLVDVNDILALWVDVEARQEASCTGCV